MAQRAGCTASLLLGAAVLLAGPAVVRGEVNTEYRDFEIFVDGKPAGESRLVLIQQDDGTTYMKANASVKVQGLFQFTFTIDAQEWWKDGKLLGLKALTMENKKQTSVEVSNDGKQLVVRVNGQARTMGPDSWTTSYWKLADARFHNQKVAILETDTGNQFVGKLQFVAEEQITISGKLEKCYHFRVTEASSPTDLWFDKYHRLVRQEFHESGHHTTVQLSAIRR